MSAARLNVTTEITGLPGGFDLLRNIFLFKNLIHNSRCDPGSRLMISTGAPPENSKQYILKYKGKP